MQQFAEVIQPVDSPPPSRPIEWPGPIAATLISIGAGWLSGVLLPLGPTTAAHGIALMLGGAATGALAGLGMRSRWAMLLAPAAYLVALEAARGTDGVPSVGELRLDSSYGVLAFLLGRVIPAGLAVMPMVLAADWGSDHIRRGCQGRPPSRMIAPTVILGVVAGLLAWPASTPALAGTDGRPLPGAVAELVRVRLGGHDQWIQVRGASRELPILLYLSGGPGQSDLAYSRVLLDGLTQDFLVVGWDQRGAGKSYPALDPATLTLDRAVADAVELAEFLRDRYDQDQVVLMGESWGSLLGVLAVQRAPQLFRAFVGSGQMVSVLETDLRIYHDLLDAAQRTGSTELAARLWESGPPPYADPLDYAFVMAHYPLLEGSYLPPAAYRQRGERSGIGPMGILGQEYGAVEKVNVLRGLLDMFSVLYPQLQGVDLRRDAPRLEVPVIVLEGSNELAARVEPAREWFDALDAPRKELHALPDSGHSVAFEQADELRRILLAELARSQP
ncbi:MAG: alpha/beta hydrolase [Actinobacteria bacterium]|nr:alpha/beta hydrolase [Actinomycetota bacterium]MCA0296823.1 alpha/beta hydrolase [Actinomycetota bacterium]